MDTFGGAIDLKEGSLVACSCDTTKRKKGCGVKEHRGYVRSIEYRRGGQFKSAQVELAEGGEVEALPPPRRSVDRVKGKYYIERSLEMSLIGHGITVGRPSWDRSIAPCRIQSQRNQ